jgi:hypothetical protein
MKPEFCQDSADPIEHVDFMGSRFEYPLLFLIGCFRPNTITFQFLAINNTIFLHNILDACFRLKSHRLQGLHLCTLKLMHKNDEF